MKSVETKLQEYAPDLRHTNALDFLQPAQELDQESFWQH